MFPATPGCPTAACRFWGRSVREGMLPVRDTAAVTAALLVGDYYSQQSPLVSATSTDGTVAYAYDSTGQLVTADYSGSQADEAYTYDSNGNRTSPGSVIGDGNRLLSDGTYTYTYDADGNRTSRFVWVDADTDGQVDSNEKSQITNYSWDTRNRLVSVTNYAAEGGSPTQIVAYFYDLENRLVGENLDSNGDGVVDHQTRYAYDGRQIALQFDKDGTGDVTAANLSHRYVWGPAVDQVLADEQVTSTQTAGNVVWPLADHLGTVRDLAFRDPQTGVTTVANHRVFDSFGNLKSETNAAVDCLFGFTGLPLDEGSGTYRTATRPYDPRTGRWLQPDWIGFNGQDANLYRYCGNSPTDRKDPTGLYDSDIHFYFVYYLAHYLGLADKMSGFRTDGQEVSWAYVIAWMSQYVDMDETTTPLHIGAVDARRRFHFVGPDDTTNANDPRVRTALDTAAARREYALVGILTHVYADTFSHQGYGPKTGHWTHDVDRLYLHQDRDEAMARALYDRIYAVAQAMGCDLTGKSFDEFWNQVRGVLFTREAGEQGRIEAWRNFLAARHIEINFANSIGATDPWVVLFLALVRGIGR